MITTKREFNFSVFSISFRSHLSFAALGFNLKAHVHNRTFKFKHDLFFFI